ncbi:MAG: hypothetical protein SGPRY_012099, partial [Prymnesium sp.]
MPLVKLLRVLDRSQQKPMIGKVYDRMFLIGERHRRVEATVLVKNMGEKQQER